MITISGIIVINFITSASKVTFSTQVEMTLFLVTHWKLELRNSSNPNEGVRMVIVLKRKIMSEMLVTYFPSFLLMAITFATTFFKPFFFEAGLSVNLTTMLVMTTIFISVMEKLPLTSYPKMIDFWLIFCQVGNSKNF